MTTETNGVQDQDKKIPSLMTSLSHKDIGNFQPFYKRYFTAKYYTEFTKPESNADVCIRIHTNKICVVYLSKHHQIFKDGLSIKNLDFQINSRTNRLCNTTKGKGKYGAQELNHNSVLCIAEASNGQKYPIRAGMKGKLLEINENLLKNFNLMVEDPNSHGWIAIILPDMGRFEESVSRLVKEEDYLPINHEAKT